MIRDAMEPLGRALMDYQQTGATTEALRIVREDGFIADYSVPALFGDEPIAKIDLEAMDACHGRILDVGAGAGRHALALQAAGKSVEAIDISPEAVRVMASRGVVSARCADIWTFNSKPFDSILLLAHGLGMAGTLARLPQLLDRLADLLSDGGCVLADSLDVAASTDEAHLRYQAQITAAGRYRGDIRVHLEYGKIAGSAFRWLLIDFRTLVEVANERGWNCELLEETPHGEFLARLVRPRSG